MFVLGGIVSPSIIIVFSFSSITIAKACRYFNLDRSNLVNGRLGREKEKMVRKYIENELAKVYLEESDVYVKDSTL